MDKGFLVVLTIALMSACGVFAWATQAHLGWLPKSRATVLAWLTGIAAFLLLSAFEIRPS